MATPTTNRKAPNLDAGLDHPEINLNAAHANFDRRDSKAAISVTSADYTMTETEQLAGVWEVSGLTAARALKIDASLGSSHVAVVYNNSSYNLTVQTTTAGTNRTVVILAGRTR